MAAIDAAKERLAPWMDRVTLIHGNFSELGDALREAGIAGADGMLFDLGVSSPQLDDASRGFSYMQDAPLDMRMDRSSALTAKEIVNTYSEEELTRILREYGEERCAARIASNIVKARSKKPLETTGELSAIVRASIPAKMREKGGNPDKRTFQAIRIACNRELDVLRDSLDTMIDLLTPGGRLCVITFHSLEDRIVKNAFKRNENPCTCPPEFPVCVCGKKSKGRVVTRKAIAPSAHELEVNRRSASAKLRVFERR
jgi:16S rRNA (cytosine1402-N4)-methyltransferase